MNSTDRPSLQRWQPAADEFACTGQLADLPGAMRKALYVPAGARALLTLDGESREFGPGEHEIESFFTRINQLWQSARGEILLVRQAPFTLEFAFSGLPSAEWLALDLRLGMQIRLEQIHAFARHFLLEHAHGAIHAQELHALCQPVLRQAAAEWLAAYSLPELGAHQLLREQLEEKLHSALQPWLAQYGLGLFALHIADLSHPAQRERQSEQAQAQQRWQILRNDMRQELDWRQELANLYSEKEWQTLQLQQQSMQRQLQSQQEQALAQQKIQGQARLAGQELNLQEDERRQALRARKIALLGRVLEADNEEAAMRVGAHDALRELQHEYAQQAVQRLDAVRRWQHLQTMAQIRMQAECLQQQHESRARLALMRMQFSNRLQQMRAENALQHQRHALAMQAEKQVARHHTELREGQARLEQHSTLAELALRQQDQALQLQARAHQAQQQQALSEAQHAAACAQLERRAQAEDIALQHSKLRGALELQAQFEQQRAEREQARLDAQVLREARLQASAAQQTQMRIQQQQAAELARIQAMAELDELALLALAPEKNAALLAQVLQARNGGKA
ncbi:SPFH domain-containing protein [Massilia sp. W12]|uniref:SPFH domain-containing protein n=1 Tax=Massilia sp. W12 TaxID=3126507 RepID=UPI0030D3113D